MRNRVSVPNKNDFEILSNNECDLDFVIKYSSIDSIESVDYPHQLYYFGGQIGTAKNENELTACLHELIRITNNNKDTFIQIQELRMKIRNGNMHVLVPKFVPIKYQGGYDGDLIVNSKTGEAFIHFDGREILELARYLKNGRSIKWCMDQMFHNNDEKLIHQPDISEQDFYTFEQYYFEGRMNNILKHICYKSMEDAGFILYRRNKSIYSEDYHQYVYEKKIDVKHQMNTLSVKGAVNEV